jgi:serine/threonine protein kinase
VFFVPSRDGLPILKLGDFGEAKTLESKLTHSINLGTNEFRAPEVYGNMMTEEKNKGHNEKADSELFIMYLY